MSTRPVRRAVGRAPLTVAAVALPLVLGQGPVPRLPPSLTVRPAAAPAPVPVSLTATRLTTTGFAYAGVVSVPSAAGAVAALRFTIAAATASELVMSTGCGGGPALVLSAADGAAPSGLVIDATSLQASVAGAPIALSAAAPPDPASVPTGDLVLTDVSVHAVAVRATGLRLAGTGLAPGSCGP
ncbi:MAG: hypothetical protein ACTHMS_12810 [Jatrophihabitans sp.]|uniref:hypothetical protein n=1 Tax=Jatrophihabitans sp. TaxID=1932789 RepID=UPI003F7FEF52